MSWGAATIYTIQNRITISQRMLSHLCRTLQGLFLNVTVYVDVSGQPDEDFMKLVSSPILFTSHGSYATAALLANTIQKSFTRMFQSPSQFSWTRAASRS